MIFWTLRESFPPPFPERELAADLLDEAANCLLSHPYEEAREKLRLSDMVTVSRYASRIKGPGTSTFIADVSLPSSRKVWTKLERVGLHLLWLRICTHATVGAAAFADAVS